MTIQDTESTLFDIPRPSPEPKNPTPKIVDKAFKHSVVDSKMTPIESLTAYIGGSNWVVDYYSQHFNPSEELKAFDPSQLNVYQNYTKINRFVLKLQGALSNDDEKDTGRYAVTGTANVIPMPNLVPNVGDAFIADIGEGSAGQFTVTDVRKLAVNLASAYEITFKLERVADRSITAMLDSKVVRNLFFRMDYLVSGQDPLLTTEEYNYARWFENGYDQVIARYVESFYQYESSTIVQPGTPVVTYDPFVTKMLLELLDNKGPNGRKIIEYNVDDYRIPSFRSIYEVCYHQDESMLYSSFKGHGLLDPSFMATSMYQNSIRYSSIRSVVVPLPERDDVNNYNELIDMMNQGGIKSNSAGWYPGGCTKTPLDCVIREQASSCCSCCNTTHCSNENKDDNKISNLDIGMDIPDVTGPTYIMSSAFYDKDLMNCTLFERLMWNVIERKPLDNSAVKAFMDCYYKWTAIQRYYLGPLLLILLRAAIRGL